MEKTNNLQTLNEKLRNLEKEIDKTSKNIKKELLVYCKEQYEGKLLESDDKKRFKIRKVQSIKHSCGDTYALYVTGNLLEKRPLVSYASVNYGESYTTKTYCYRIEININGKLLYWKISNEVSRFDKEYNNWMKDLEKYQDANGELIRGKYVTVHFVTDGKMERGTIYDFDKKKNKFVILDKNNEYLYLEGKEFLLAN